MTSALAGLLGDAPLDQLREATVVVLPSVTTSDEELRRTPGAMFLDERLLFALLLLRHPGMRVLYVTSLPVDPAIVDYHLRHVPDPAGAVQRLHLLPLGDGAPRALTHKLLDRPAALARLRDEIGDPSRAYLLCYKVTRAEHRVARALEIPLDGPGVRHLPLDSKSAARRVARRAGVSILPGEEGLRSLCDVEAALERLRTRGGAPAAMLKLNDGFAGRGNAVVSLERPLSSLCGDAVELIAADESWEAFVAKIERGGAVVEELLDRPGTVSSCAQMRIAPSGAVQVVSIYDMLLAGDRGQVYAGCRCPSPPSHRLAVRDAAMSVAQTMADDGVRGWFGLDFVIDRSTPEPTAYLCEINLRMGGGTHPFWLALLASGGEYDPATGDLRAGGRPKAYVATDDVASERLSGCSPAEVIRRIDAAGLAFDASRGTGVLLQFLGAVPRLGMMGMTCVGDSPEEAELLRREATAAVTGAWTAVAAPAR